MTALCRDCAAHAGSAKRCPQCGGRRIVRHDELAELSIAHLDCDAFYASIEKRDRPELAAKPVIVGGGKRGVATTACYVARTFGVRSAMPMFQALKLCPNAVVIRPRMAKYAEVAHHIRALMEDLTPLVETLSLDEAYLDLTGTARLHHHTPAASMILLAKRVEDEIGITVSVGLSYNKFLAKLASDLEKPRGFAVIGRAEAVGFLRGKPVGMIRGVGPIMQKRLNADGFVRIADLQDASARDLAKRYGETGLWLHRVAHGEDSRHVEAGGESKSVSSETTFESDIADYRELEHVLWEQAERVSARAKAEGVGGRTVTLKLKTAHFKIKTRSLSLEEPTQLADAIFRVGRTLLKREADGTKYRLLGVGISQIRPAVECDPPDLVDKDAEKRASAERAMDKVRAKYGRDAVKKGRGI